MKIDYITSNRQKFEEAQHVFFDWELQHIHLDLKEIQGSDFEVIKAKANEALHLLKRPLIVEDVSLCCPAIGGLPGPYIKDFLKKLGDQGFSELIHKFSDHSVEAICHAAFAKPGIEPMVFKGSIEGRITAPRGHLNHGIFSWNAIFQPKGFDKTFGEMTLKELSGFSMRCLALTKLKHYLEKHPV